MAPRWAPSVLLNLEAFHPELQEMQLQEMQQMQLQEMQSAMAFAIAPRIARNARNAILLLLQCASHSPPHLLVIASF